MENTRVFHSFVYFFFEQTVCFGEFPVYGTSVIFRENLEQHSVELKRRWLQICSTRLFTGKILVVVASRGQIWSSLLFMSRLQKPI